MNYLTRDQVAQKLRVSVRTVSTYVANGVLSPPARLGRKPLWLEDVIARDMERSRAAPGGGGGEQTGKVRKGAAKREKRGRGRPRKL